MLINDNLSLFTNSWPTNEEIALLRLKLGKERVGNLDDGKSSKKVITNLPQLVAKMFFRRHETARPLANRRILAYSTETYVPSSLSRGVASDDLLSGQR